MLEAKSAGEQLIESGISEQFWGRDIRAERVCDRLDAASLLLFELKQLRSWNSPVSFGVNALRFLMLGISAMMDDKAVPVRDKALEALGLVCMLVTQPDDLKEVQHHLNHILKKSALNLQQASLQPTVLATLSLISRRNLITRSRVFDTLVGYLTSREPGCFSEEDLQLFGFTVTHFACQMAMNQATSRLCIHALTIARSLRDGNMLTSCMRSLATLFNYGCRNADGVLKLPLSSLKAAARGEGRGIWQGTVTLAHLAGMRLCEVVRTLARQEAEELSRVLSIRSKPVAFKLKPSSKARLQLAVSYLEIGMRVRSFALIVASLEYIELAVVLYTRYGGKLEVADHVEIGGKTLQLLAAHALGVSGAASEHKYF